MKGFGRRPPERGADDYDNYDSRYPKPFTYPAASGARVISDKSRLPIIGVITHVQITEGSLRLSMY